MTTKVRGSYDQEVIWRLLKYIIFFKLFENYRELTSQWFIFYAIFSVIFHNKNAFKEHGTKYCGWIQSHYLNDINVTVHILLGISTLCYIWHFSIFLFWKIYRYIKLGFSHVILPFKKLIQEERNNMVCNSSLCLAIECEMFCFN